MFYRYTVPGAVIVLTFMLTFPDKVLTKDWTINPLFGTAVIGNVIIAGWASYNAIYPILKKILSYLRIFPKAAFLNEILIILKENNKTANANRIWSYFLWTKGTNDLRERIKVVADIGHSMFIVGFTFLIFPVINAIGGLFIDSTLLERGIKSIFGASSSPCLLVVIYVMSLTIGIILFKHGHARIKEAHEIQGIFFYENKTSIEDIIKKFN